MGEETNASLVENMEIKDFDLPGLKEEISSLCCEEMDVSGAYVKEEGEMHSDESSELYKSSPDCMDDSLPEPCRKEDQGCWNDSITQFCFVRIKMEEPDETDTLFDASPKRNSFAQGYPTNPEKDSSTVDSGLHEKSKSVKLNSPSCRVGIKKETEDSVCCCKSGAQTNEDTSVSEDVNNELNSNSVMHRCDMGHSRHEFIRGIECQQFPILCIKQEEKSTLAQCVMKSNKTASRTCGSLRRGEKCIVEERSALTTFGQSQESLYCTLHDAEIRSKMICDVEQASVEDREVLSESMFEDGFQGVATGEFSPIPLMVAD